MTVPAEARNRPLVGTRLNEKERRCARSDGWRDEGCVGNSKFSVIDAENLAAIRYGIVSGAGNRATVVTRAAAPVSRLKRSNVIAHGLRLQPRIRRVRQTA
jgi:hypothetical protein